MNSYHIEHRITTIAELYDPFEFRGFKITPWNYDPVSGTCGNAWSASKNIEANNASDALSNFTSQLFAVVDRIAFVSQCYTVAELDPFLILKKNDNRRLQLYFRYSEVASVVPLMFMQNEISALKDLENYEQKGDVFRYLREATNAPGLHARLTMMISALEAMAGELKDLNARQKVTDKKYIKNDILKDEALYKAVFGYGTGVRQKLAHGGKVDLTPTENEDTNYVRRVYDAILRYFRESHRVVINTKVVGPQRNPIGNYRGWSGWIEPIRSDIPLDLLSLHQAFKNTHDGGDKDSDANFIEQFKILDRAPAGY